jgi:hypothetical protein
MAVWCRACYKEYSKERRKDPEKEAKDAAYRKQRYEKLRATGEYQLRQKVSKLKCLFGLTIEQYAMMSVKQNGVCAICGRPPLREGKECCLDVDHDHATGQIRGLLCKGCNLMLGNAQDNPGILRKAAEYLER